MAPGPLVCYVNACMLSANVLFNLNKGLYHQSMYVADDALCEVIVELFIGGADTTTTTLRWSLLYFVEHPVIQVKCQEEIDMVRSLATLPQY